VLARVHGLGSHTSPWVTHVQALPVSAEAFRHLPDASGDCTASQTKHQPPDSTHERVGGAGWNSRNHLSAKGLSERPGLSGAAGSWGAPAESRVLDRQDIGRI